MRLGEFRIGLDGLAERMFGIGPTVLGGPGEPQITERLGIAGIKGNGRLVMAGGGLRIAASEAGIAQIDMGGSVIGVFAARELDDLLADAPGRQPKACAKAARASP